MTQLVVKNEGGPGRFCIMPSAAWPTTNFKVIVQLSSWRLSCDTAGSKERRWSPEDSILCQVLHGLQLTLR